MEIFVKVNILISFEKILIKQKVREIKNLIDNKIPRAEIIKRQP